MTSYLSSLLTNTTSRYNNLRRSLLSDESDGDTEDDSHICRVLRAYYIEKGRPFPPWLPPDPKQRASHAASVPPASMTRQQAPLAQAKRGGGLSDLWDSPQQRGSPQPVSLRRSEGSALRTAQTQRTPTASYFTPQSGRELVPPVNEPSSQRQQPQGSRPLPSQRVGSYQNQMQLQAAKPERPPMASMQSSSAQDRLKAKLWGGGKPSSLDDNQSNIDASNSAARLAFARSNGQALSSS